MRTIPLLFLIALTTLASCAKRATSEDAASPPPEPTPLHFPPRNAPAQSPMSDLKPLPNQSESVLINAGPLPLIHLFDQGGPIRILNVTTKQTLLDTTVPPGSIISVTDSGILIGRTRRLTTRLDPKHRYELWWDVARGR